MTQGIRAFAIASFNKNLPKLGESLDAAGFRRKVMESIVNKFEISVASAATHYNHAKKVAQAADPKLVLGRAEDKKGGRPVLHPVTVVKAKSGAVVAEGISREAAKAMVAAAAGKGKVKLAIAGDQAEEATA